ncbi:MAG: signal peptidase II [Clostridia bacterium]|nr:signal peptidase II [Clostridia bacterium]
MDIKKLFVKKRVSDYAIFSVIIVVGIILDQLTKWLAVTYLKPIWSDSVPIIEGVLQLTYAENTGAAFSMLSDAPWVFKSISTVAIIAMAIYLYGCKGGRRLQDVALAMIVSGGIGNMIDRLSFYGLLPMNEGVTVVRDFIDFCLIDFAIFNGADSFVCVGAGLLILSLILDMKDEYKKEQEAKAKRENPPSEGDAE